MAKGTLGDLPTRNSARDTALVSDCCRAGVVACPAGRRGSGNHYRQPNRRLDHTKHYCATKVEPTSESTTQSITAA